jgi:type III restriction enzyme
MTGAIDNPILNSPYKQPDRYYEVGPQGPTGEMKDGCCPCESLFPVAVTKKGKDGEAESEQEALDFDATGERREKNSLINEQSRGTRSTKPPRVRSSSQQPGRSRSRSSRTTATK